jgi:hypothetical protein
LNDSIVKLSWEGQHVNNQIRKKSAFKTYELFRRHDNENFQLLSDSVLTNFYTDNLFHHPDGTYQYAIRAVYSSGVSDMVIFNSVFLERFVPVKFLISLSDNSTPEGIKIQLIDVNNVGSPSIERESNSTGLILLNNLKYGTYFARISKNEYIPLKKEIKISKDNNSFIYQLISIDSFHKGDVNCDSTLDLRDAIIGLKVLTNTKVLNFCSYPDLSIGFSDIIIVLNIIANNE